MTTISIFTQISIYDIFGKHGCVVYASSIRLHGRLLVVSGFGMAIFRIVCIENLAKQIERKKLAKIIYIVEYAVIILITISFQIVLEKYYSLWEEPILYQFCKDDGLAKADILQAYNGYDFENKGFGESCIFLFLLVIL